MIGTLFIRMPLVTSLKTKQNKTKTNKQTGLTRKGKFDGETVCPPVWFHPSACDPSNHSVRALPSSTLPSASGGRPPLSQGVDSKQNQNKTVCSGVSVLCSPKPCSWPTLLPHRQQGSRVQQPMAGLAFSIKISPWSWNLYLCPCVYCQQMNFSGQPEVTAAGIYWKEKGGIGEDSVRA